MRVVKKATIPAFFVVANTGKRRPFGIKETAQIFIVNKKIDSLTLCAGQQHDAPAHRERSN
jgi:hypothetical protein